MAHRYADLLTDRDLEALGALSGHGPRPTLEGRGDDHHAIDDAPVVAWFRERPERIEQALDDPATTDRLFATEDGTEHAAIGVAAVTPLLVFAAVIHRAAADIGDIIHIPERFGSGLVIPVFDGERLARFTATPANRVFLVELLGSYARVSSGPLWERNRGRWRRRRFSEMNPAQLARVAAELPLDDRAGAYRRLGDLALFLNGVFPDHSARQTLSPIDLERILRSLPADHRHGHEAVQRLQVERVDGCGPVLAALGPIWYRLAAQLVPIPSMSDQLHHVAEHFDQARRFLGFTTDRWLWPRRDGLFPTH